MSATDPKPSIPIPGLPGFDLEPGEDGYSIRAVPDPVIDSKIRQALADLDAMDADKRFAAILHADLDGAQLVAMVRIAKGWSFAGVLDRDWTGERRLGAEVRFSK